MAKSRRSSEVKQLRVFVSSPGDVQAARRAVEGVVARINTTLGDTHRFLLTLWKWERDSAPKIGDLPQQVIDQQLPDYDIYLGIMSSRFGTPAEGFGSGTEKEFRDAVDRYSREKRPWILFYFDDSPPPPRTKQAAEQLVRVLGFREELENLGVVGSYVGLEGCDDCFVHQVQQDLTRIALKLAAPGGPEPTPPADDPTRYARSLLVQCSSIEIRGLNIGTGEVHRLPIEDLYITLRTHVARGEESSRRGKDKPDALADDRRGLAEPPARQELQRALAAPQLVVIGDPGAGKTTFLRRIAGALCRTCLGLDGSEADWLPAEMLSGPEFGGKKGGNGPQPALPVLVSLAELSAYIRGPAAHSSGCPATPESAAWIPHFLARLSADNHWGLDEGFFIERLNRGECVLLLDGLDEAPDQIAREIVSQLIRNVAATYDQCRLVVTSRPAAYTAEVVLPDFTHARIEPLDDETVSSFLTRWCRILYPESPPEADRHCGELLAALRARPDIRRMARNPVMLTALAVVHWNERRLPEQRADLYQSILTWLSRARRRRPGRPDADYCLVLLQELALAMQKHPEGRQVQVPRRWAAEAIANEMPASGGSPRTIDDAERFLDEEQLDSGIIVARGNDLRFWHLTFQEYLAAKAVAARPDTEQIELLLKGPKSLYDPAWHEVVLLLAGVLHQQQGRQKVDALFTAVLDNLGPRPRLANQARAAGLLGGIVRDLTPLKYRPGNPGYDRLLQQTLRIFDAQASTRIALKTRRAAAEALGQAGDPRLEPNHPDRWMEIPGGTFLMGMQDKDPQQPNFEKEDVQSHETPVHEVQLDTFRIARYPVTVQDFRQFVDHGGYAEEKWWHEGGFRKFDEPEGWPDQLEHPNRPVVGVSWYEAAAFCVWAGYRLPTEAQWERAARGTDGRRFPWGNEPATPSLLNFDKSEIREPTPVGLYPRGASLEGVLDMAGNVWEWCHDWFSDGYYLKSPRENPCGPETGESRVLRGGCWGLSANLCRAAFRYRSAPAGRLIGVGFRVLVSRQDL